MSLVIPDAAAISSIEVAAYPLRANAAAAPRRIAACRSARGRGPLGGAAGSAVRAGIGIRKSIPSTVYRNPRESRDEQPADVVDRGRAARERARGRAAHGG